TFACLSLGVVREVLGNGSIAGFRVFGPGFEPWSVMILPGGAFFVLGGWLLLFNWMRERRKARQI
ncbi:MAG: electron transport complex subunit RsxE, partial [bacterium]